MHEMRLHLHMVTVFHPERFLGCEEISLRTIPAIRRERSGIEETRKQFAETGKLYLTYQMFHGRIISSHGKPTNALRKTWIDTSGLAALLSDYELRLIDTEETGTQARWRCEFRPNWGGQGEDWPGDLRAKMLEGIDRSRQVSIRQVWRNPLAARAGILPLGIPEENAEYVANLMVGPMEPQVSREARVRYEFADGVWWMLFSGS